MPRKRMRGTRIDRVRVVVLAAAVCASAAATNAAAQAVLQSTPVTGPSTLRRHGLTVERTSMGFTGHLGPGADTPASALRPAVVLSEPAGTVAVSGADLYRLNCRACHRATGEGSPPEINTLIAPVQGTSIALWQKRMLELDRPIDPAFATQVVTTARADLFKRIKEGGQKMPGFAYLRDDEMAALFAYLELLAEVPGATQRQRRVTERPTRIGEFIVKGTCHICHDATGTWPSPAALMDGVVPPLDGMLARHSEASVIQKVRIGAPITMGITPVLYRGRMPVLDYVTNDEAAAAYLYLAAYPPRN
jgi:mono/diheme cytochrome c family protein